MPTDLTLNDVRIDKWLWAARFYKTRQLAVKAIKNSKVSLNSQRVKPAAHVKVGDTLTVKHGPYQLQIIINKLSEQRGPAKTAQTLYAETEQSISDRETLRRQLNNQPKIQIDRHKPDKRAIRSNRALKRGE